VKPDTEITKKLIVNLAKKKSQAPTPVVNKIVSYNFDFSSFWSPFSSLYSYFSTGAPPKDLPKSSQQDQCEHTLQTAAAMLREASIMLEKNAQGMSADPKKFEEALMKISELGQSLSQLGSGLIDQEPPKQSQPEPIKSEKTAEEEADDLMDDLFADLEDAPQIEINQTVVPSNSSQSSNPNNMLDIMNSLMKPADNKKGTPPAANLLNMFMNNQKNSAPEPSSKSPTAWKNSMTPKKSSQYAKIFQRDMRDMRNRKLKLSANYLLGSSNVDTAKLRSMLASASKV
jgi:hypothetical protein